MKTFEQENKVTSDRWTTCCEMKPAHNRGVCQFVYKQFNAKWL